MFITFEGPDKCGKSTQAKLLADYLRSQDYKIVHTREPGGTPMAEEIRNTLLLRREERVYPMTELLLFFAARKQHVENLIKPALEKGITVISERFYDSSYVYQVAQNNEECGELFWSLLASVCSTCVPDLTFILDISEEEFLKRLKDADRIEQKGVLFFNSARKTYLEIAITHKRFVVIDGSRDQEEVQEEIRKSLKEAL